jgi:enoyl-CoA hydratase
MPGQTRLTTSHHMHVHVITMDDGKVNAMSPDMLRDLHSAFDAAEEDDTVKVVLLTSAARVFSAGFDMSVFAASPEGSLEMLQLGARMTEKILGFPKPVVTACSGHAYPMGAFLMLAADLRLGADGDYRIGMNEVAINMTLPRFAIEIARQRLTPAAFNTFLMTGEMLPPQEAAIAGFIDRVLPADGFADKALEAAIRLTEINTGCHRASKQKARATALAALREAIDAELTPNNFAKAFTA